MNGMTCALRSDRSHSNYNGAQVAGVEKQERKIPIEIQIQQQAVDLDEEVFGVAAPMVGPCVAASGSSSVLNALGGVKPLAFGQYGELEPGFEHSSWATS
jgi:hypothetical protein